MSVKYRSYIGCWVRMTKIKNDEVLQPWSEVVGAIIIVRSPLEALFHHRLTKKTTYYTVCGLTGVVWYLDDVSVFAEMKPELGKKLWKVIESLKERALELNTWQMHVWCTTSRSLGSLSNRWRNQTRSSYHTVSFQSPEQKM